MKKLVAGNWKMNGLTAALSEITTLAEMCAADVPKCDVLICPSATLLAAASATAQGTVIQTGGQDCHVNESGAHTGDVSGAMLKDAGAAYVIVGHSERRADHGERDADVKAKAAAAVSAGLIPIICVGETQAEREAGKAVEIVTAQVQGSMISAEKVVVAYEPVWAIGTGLVPTLADIAEIHAAIREVIGDHIQILYGGSVKPDNAAEILHVPNVDGALVGGASLKAADFFGIIKAA